MSYDFYIEKVEEFESVINENVNTIEQVDFSAHVKYKIMQSLICAHPQVKDKLRNLYQTQTTQVINPFPTKCNPINVTQYPDYTIFLQFKFRLAKPYISRDDEIFYICENPIRKDKVSKVPMVSASTWKGNMRFSAHMASNLSTDASNSDEISRLFGNEKAVSSDFHQGRVWFYNTYFKKIALEVINPHDRKTKAGTNPITIEAVPSGEEGYFSLVYCPFDLMGCCDAERVKDEVSADINLLSEALRLMMLEYGFSAKKTSGYGIIKPKVREVIIRMKGLQPRTLNGEVLFENLVTELQCLANELKGD